MDSPIAKPEQTSRKHGGIGFLSLSILCLAGAVLFFALRHAPAPTVVYVQPAVPAVQTANRPPAPVPVAIAVTPLNTRPAPAPVAPTAVQSITTSVPAEQHQAESQAKHVIVKSHGYDYDCTQAKFDYTVGPGAVATNINDVTSYNRVCSALTGPIQDGGN